MDEKKYFETNWDTHPRSRKRAAPPGTKEKKEHSPAGEGGGGSISDDWRKSLVY
jgi:hypothetical protein